MHFTVVFPFAKHLPVTPPVSFLISTPTLPLHSRWASSDESSFIPSGQTPYGGSLLPGTGGAAPQPVVNRRNPPTMRMRREPFVMLPVCTSRLAPGKRLFATAEVVAFATSGLIRRSASSGSAGGPAGTATVPLSSGLRAGGEGSRSSGRAGSDVVAGAAGSAGRDFAEGVKGEIAPGPRPARLRSRRAETARIAFRVCNYEMSPARQVPGGLGGLDDGGVTSATGRGCLGLRAARSRGRPEPSGAGSSSDITASRVTAGLRPA